eukprot:UN01182
MQAPVLQQKVRLDFAADKLKGKDVLSKSDPFLKLYQRETSGKWTNVFTTEHIQNKDDPKWSKSFEVDYHFEQNQVFKAEVYDYDSNSSHDLICSAEFQLGQVMASYGGSLRIQAYKPGKTKASKKMAIIVTGTAMVQSNLYLDLDVKVKNVKKSSFFANIDKDDLCFQLVKQKPDGTELVVYQSEIVYDTQKPDFKPTVVPLGDLCNADLNQKFTVRLMRYTSKKEFEFVGDNKDITVNMIQVQKGGLEKKIDLFDKKGKDICDFFFEKAEVITQYSFLDYLAGGLDFNLTVAIDFTGSNGDPRSPSSLHYIDPTGNKKNQYIESLRSIGNILLAYAQKQFVPTLGFGGFVALGDGVNPPAAPVTSHCFPLSLRTDMPYANGMEDAVAQYVNAVTNVQLSGPTYFEPVIRASTVPALRPYTPNYQHFNLLLLIADGTMNDFDAAVDAIVEASDKPLAIIIVGVGNADFKQMERLDGDDGKLKSKKHGYVKNDIVQFVEFNKFNGDVNALAAATLKEIPDTVLRFMRMHRIAPAQRLAPPQQQF